MGNINGPMNQRISGVSETVFSFLVLLVGIHLLYNSPDVLDGCVIFFCVCVKLLCKLHFKREKK